MARKLSKISALLGMESKARSRKSTDIAKMAGTKLPRILFDAFGGGEIPILESAFSKWEDKRNKLADAKNRKHDTDQKYRKDPAEKRTAEEMVDEARKSRQDAKQAAQAQTAHQRKLDAYNSAVADQGSTQLKTLVSIKHELSEIKGILRIGGKAVGGKAEAGSSGGGMLGTLWNLLPGKWKGKIGGKAAEIAEKFGGKKIGSLVKIAASAAGAEGLEKVGEKTAAELAGSGLGAAAKAVAPEAAEGVTKAASGGILGRVMGFGKSALNGAEGLVGSGKSALGSLWKNTGGKVGGLFKSGEKFAGAEGEKILGKVGGEEAEKLGGKLLAKEGGKAIPLIGNVIGLATSLGFAGKRLWEGDLAGAGMEAGSGLLNLIPGVGNYLSIAADVGIAARDLKRAHTASNLGKIAGKHAEPASKSLKEVSEEGAKLIEEKADQSKEAAEGVADADSADDDDKKKKKSKFREIASAMNPIGVAYAADTPPVNLNGTLKSITPKGAALASTIGNKKSPIEQLAFYMAGLFGLASDESKGVYVRSANAPFADNTAAAPSPIPKNEPTATSSSVAAAPGPGTVSQLPDMVVTAPSSSSSSVVPVSQSFSGSQPGAETNGGWHTGSANGRLHFNMSADAAGTIGAAPKTYGSVNGFNIDSMWDQMKGTIAQGESGKAGYDAHHGGTIQGLTRMTIGQIKQMKGAMGKYQLLPGTTLGEAAKGVGLSDNDLFSPANQEAMGKWLFARRVKAGAKNGVQGIQSQLAHEWASLPVDSSGRGAYDGYAGNMAAGGSARGQALASTISASQSGATGSMSGVSSNTANAIDEATQEVAKSDTSNAPTVVVAPGGSGGSAPATAAPGTGGGVSGPMLTRNTDSTVQNITQNFIRGSSAMG